MSEWLEQTEPGAAPPQLLVPASHGLLCGDHQAQDGNKEQGKLDKIPLLVTNLPMLTTPLFKLHYLSTPNLANPQFCLTLIVEPIMQFQSSFWLGMY